MDHRFEAETLLDQRTFAEFQRSYTCAMPLTTVSRIILIGASIYYLCHFDRPIFVFGFLLVAGIILISQLIQNRKGGTTQYKRMLVANNGKPNHSVLHFRETDIQDTSLDTGNVFTYSYDRIRYLINAPKLILAVLDYRLCIIIQKDTITGGTPEELIAFLKDRTPKSKGRVRKTELGLWVGRVLNGILVAGCLFALLNLPGISLMDRLSGELTNSMSYREMAEELNTLGIQITDRTIEELEDYDAQFQAQYGESYYRNNPRASKVLDLLYWEGSGIIDWDTMEWTPSASGIYWMDLEVWRVDTIYTDFLTGLDTMSDAITVSDIREDYTDADVESGSGSIGVSFRLNGKDHFLDAWYNYDWFDTEIVVRLGEILEADADARDLYVSDDGGQGLYFFYSDAQTARQLSRMTGLEFCPASRLYSLY